MMTRRNLIQGAAIAAQVAKAQTPAIPIIDCHIHLFDQTRPQGAPYSAAPGNTEPALPARYRKIAAPLGIVGAIEIDASPWVEDNLWVLETIEKDPIMVGTIGNLRPEKPEFGEFLERYHKNKLFRGIRYGNNWGYNIAKESGNPVFIEGLKLLQQADMTLDTANPRADLLEAVVRVTDRVPGLRVVVDHLPSLIGRLDAAALTALEPTVRELAARPQVYVKVSEVLRVVDGKPVTDAAAYKPVLDYCFDMFGPDRLLFGSDWPNAAAVDHAPLIVKIVRDYFEGKGRGPAEKYFWKNSVAAYKWVKRDSGQP